MLEKDFITLWVDKIKSEFLRDFPDEFLSADLVDVVNLPGKALVLGPELFGTYEVTDSKGNPFLQTANLQLVKYYLYANRTTPASLKVPKTEKVINEAVKEYEKYLDSLVEKIESDFKKNFPDSKSFLAVSNQIFSKLNLLRF